MGKMLIHQKRGKGLPAFLSPTHHHLADIRYPDWLRAHVGVAQVMDLIDDPLRSAIIAKLSFEDGKWFYNVAAESLAIGDKVNIGGEGSSTVGAVLPLSSIPDGTPVFNLELSPSDGGKVARASGTQCHVVSHDEDTGLVSVQLVSKKSVILSPLCLATVGVVCGGERVDKPFMKAGTHYYAMKARNKYWPKVRGSAMSAYDHPHGGKSMGTPSTVSRHAPPGAKVGHIAARQTGRKKARQSSEKQGA